MVTQKEIHQLATQQGFWDHPVSIPEKLALIHSEVSEALEADRAGVAITEELADIVIRVMDLAEHLGVDLNKAIEAKHLINLSRPYKHDKRY